MLVGGGSSTGSARRLPAWRDLIRENFVALEIGLDNPADAHGRFTGSVRSRTHGELQVSEVSSINQGARRTPLLARRDHTSYLQVGLVGAGEAALGQDGRECRLRAGEFAIYETDRPFHWGLRGTPWQLAVFTWPRASVMLGPAESAAVTATRFDLAEGLSRVVGHLLADLVATRPALRPAAEARLSHQVAELVATLAIEHGAEPPADPATTDLLRRIDDYILARLADPAMGPAEIASAHFISTRQLHRLFARRGHGVAGWIRERRLERCRDELRTGRDPITEVCARWGFADPAGFSRAFRAAYRCSPSEYRRRFAPKRG